ncbi:MAG: hypothetical protein ACLPID_10665 [Beijerinckiaceae bacterium]
MTAITGWAFSPRGFNDVEQEVTESDQFNTEAVPETEALVREAVQNSQDARTKGNQSPVKLRISLRDSTNGLDPELLQELTAGLGPHLQAVGFPQIDADRVASPSALLIEDFGTEGLTGKIDDENDAGNFRSFWFRHGGSYKRGSKNGRWGLGKLVFPIASASRCFFGLTIREDDPVPLLLGQAVLRTHQLQGHKYAPHGHYGDISQKNLRPIADPQIIERFQRGFGLSRTNETGLSVVVPYPVGETDRDKLLQFVVRNYTYPILTGRLVVDVMGQIVDATHVHKIGEELLEPGLIKFIDDIHSADHSDLIRIKPRPLGSSSHITEDLIEADLSDLRARYATGELMGFYVPIRLARKNEEHVLSFVEVFLRNGAEGENGDAVYVRGDITVPEEAGQFRGAGAFAAMLARDAPVSEFLADAENPAHTKWVGTASRLGNNWKYPRPTTSLIRNAPTDLHKVLATCREQMDENALINFFWIDDPSALPGKTDGAKPKRKDGPESVPFPPLPKPKRRLILAKRKGGFTIKPGPDFQELPLPVGIKVEVCYDQEYGKPSWDKFDFEFSDDDLSIETIGAEEEHGDNRIVLIVREPDFCLTVEGFDEKRDLVIDFNVVRVREALDA